jgi:hypothetical protein
MTPTPRYVLDAIDTIVGYLRQGGWCEAIISDTGGASFNLDSIYDLIFPTQSRLTSVAADAGQRETLGDDDSRAAEPVS